MTTFYVGQRVRVVRTHWSLSYLRGSETVLTMFDGERWHTTLRMNDHGYWIGAPECFEPILYDGNKTVEWSECLWQPERTGVAA